MIKSGKNNVGPYLCAINVFLFFFMTAQTPPGICTTLKSIEFALRFWIAIFTGFVITVIIGKQVFLGFPGRTK